MQAKVTLNAHVTEVALSFEEIATTFYNEVVKQKFDFCELKNKFMPKLKYGSVTGYEENGNFDSEK